MPSPLRGFKVYWVSLLLGVSSSVTIHPFVFLVTAGSAYLISPIGAYLSNCLIGAIFGFLKSLVIRAVAYWGKPAWRWQLIIGGTVILSLLEAWLLYELRTQTLPFG